MSDTIAHNTGAAGAAPSSRSYFVREHHPENGSLLGFWLYLMSDCLIFACLFATYAVLGRSYADGPTGAALFDLPLVAVNTAMLLLSSITYGFAMLAMQRKQLRSTLVWLAITGLFGLAFLSLEMYEFMHLIHEGAGPQRDHRSASPVRLSRSDVKQRALRGPLLFLSAKRHDPCCRNRYKSAIKIMARM